MRTMRKQVHARGRRLLAPALVSAAATAGAFMPAPAARADTMLDFFNPPNAEPALETFVEDLAGYGDNVNGSPTGAYSYGGAADTPNVTADFDGLQFWDDGYANLTNVVYVDSGAGNSRPPLGVGTVTFTADPGFLVRLGSVDLAGFGASFDFDSITVTGGDAPFSRSNVPAPGDAANTLDFGRVTGQQLVLTFNDADSQESAGIDNLRFSQVPVPEPASAALLALAAMSLARRRRRRAR